MRYPVRVRLDESSFTVKFPDVPEAITCGDTIEDALRHAVDALEAALDFYFEDGRNIPPPSEPKRGQKLVTLPLEVTAKVLLHNEMLRQNVTVAELTRRMSVRAGKRVRRLDLTKSVDVDTTAQAMNAIGKHFELYLA